MWPFRTRGGRGRGGRPQRAQGGSALRSPSPRPLSPLPSDAGSPRSTGRAGAPRPPGAASRLGGASARQLRSPHRPLMPVTVRSLASPCLPCSPPPRRGPRRQLLAETPSAVRTTALQRFVHPTLVSRRPAPAPLQLAQHPPLSAPRRGPAQLQRTQHPPLATPLRGPAALQLRQHPPLSAPCRAPLPREALARESAERGRIAADEEERRAEMRSLLSHTDLVLSQQKKRLNEKFIASMRTFRSYGHDIIGRLANRTDEAEKKCGDLQRELHIAEAAGGVTCREASGRGELALEEASARLVVEQRGDGAMYFGSHGVQSHAEHRAMGAMSEEPCFDRAPTDISALAAADAGSGECDSERKNDEGGTEESENGEEDPQVSALRQTMQRRADQLLRSAQPAGGPPNGAFGDIAYVTVPLVVKRAQSVPDAAICARIIESLTREAQVLEHINSSPGGADCAVQLLGTHELGNPQAALILERLHKTLEDEAPLCGPKLAKVVLGLLSAFDNLYWLNVVNLDVKPSNAMLTAQGEPKLIDFGISQFDGQHAELGYTWPWRPLEWLLGFGQEAKCASDWHALGLMLCVAAMGRHPVTTDGPDNATSQLRLLAGLELFLGLGCAEEAREMYEQVSLTHDYTSSLFRIDHSGPWVLHSTAAQCEYQMHDVEQCMQGLSGVVADLCQWDPELRAAPGVCRQRLLPPAAGR
eukprot:TRINITY_DN18629_c0_g1_i1.p1 TRINITY_DN18629_c0_g1~~TRINITY_DN18629_c0_g1_i1.p1  ORF type:complete len:701 (+),score=165.33 TRINITY_DN18629_c0_g1_i1:103-2205(+)